MTTIKKIYLLHVVAVFTWLSACNDSAEQAAVQKMPPPPEVSVAEVIAERITEWDEFTGTLQAPEKVELRPRISGYVEKILFKEGALVSAGDILMHIDDRSVRAEISGLQAQLNSAKTQLSLAESEFERAEKLFKRKAISTEIFDARRAEKLRAEASVKSFKSSLDVARLNLSFAKVESPIDGRISRAISTKGNYVTAGQTILTSIVSVNRMHAYFSTDERTYLNYVKRSQATQTDKDKKVYMALVTDEGFPYEGTLDFIDNQINPDTGTILARANFSNDSGVLLPGMFARLRLPGSAPYDAILIDDKAVGTDFNKKFVLVLDDKNIVQYRPVTLGEKISGLRIVHTGIQKGEKIVVEGLQRVRPGSPVTPKSVPMANEKAMAEINANKLASADELNQESDATIVKKVVATSIELEK